MLYFSKYSYLLLSHMDYDLLQIKFFHKIDSLPTPVTDTEKLIWGVLEAERPTFRLSWMTSLSLCILCLNVINVDILHVGSCY